MVPLSYVWYVADRNVIMRRIPVLNSVIPYCTSQTYNFFFCENYPLKKKYWVVVAEH
jgi:hypothetical protein